MFNQVISANAIDIDAPAERVWDILIDVANYAEWNPFTPGVETSFEVGSPVLLHVRLGPLKLRQREWIQAVEPPSLVAWDSTMGVRLLLHTHRDQRLAALGETSCRYETSIAFSGVLAPVVVLLCGRAIRSGFNSVAQALKQHAEAGQ